MKYVKPRQLADAISVTTDALRKQRERGTSPYEYEVIEGRVLYDFITLPPSVRENIEKNTTKRTREKHYDIKDPRYWNSIGKKNEQRIQLTLLFKLLLFYGNINRCIKKFYTYF